MTPVPTTLKLRVTVVDAWQVCSLEAKANERVGAVKQRSLAAVHIAPARAAEYVVKFGGALVANEGSSLADLAVPDGAALVVLPARRRAAR